MWPHLPTVLLLSSFAGCAYSRDTSPPECATACSSNLMHRHGVSTVETLCYDIAKQRELFICLASSCTDDYGLALADIISICSHHGAPISNLVPVELGATGRQFSSLTARSDTAVLGFDSQFILAVDCTAGSDGVLTLSLPEPISSGIGHNAGSGSTVPVSNSDSQPGLPARPGETSGNASRGSNASGGGDRPSTEPDCDDEHPAGDSSGSNGQPHPVPAGGSPGGTSPSPNTGDAPSTPNQGTPGQPQARPAPATFPPVQNQDTPEAPQAPVPPQSASKAPVPPAPAPSAPQGPLPVSDPQPSQEDTICPDENDPSCPASNQPLSGGDDPNADAGSPPYLPPANNGNDGTCSNTDPSGGCDAPVAPAPQPASPVVPDECLDEPGNSPCHGAGSDQSSPVPDSSPALPSADPPSTSNTAVPQPGPGPISPPQGNTDASPGEGTSCGGITGPCPGEAPAQGNGPISDGQAASPGNEIPSTATTPGTMVPNVPSWPKDPQEPPSQPDEGHNDSGSENPGTGNNHGESTGQEGTSSAPAAPTQPTGPPIQTSSPSQPAEPIQERPQLITVIVPTQVEVTETKVLTV
ncbi:hypothetical protein F66182_1706 [Fusarium sp. NRRL 66182]|nr:hypothetical protein F66182_1706 [Fusarium sp. NRRL 66182]